MAVAIRAEPEFAAGAPEGLFEGVYRVETYDIASDGQRFLMVKEGSQDVAFRQFQVVLNWHQELLERVPIP